MQKLIDRVARRYLASRGPDPRGRDWKEQGKGTPQHRWNWVSAETNVTFTVREQPSNVPAHLGASVVYRLLALNGSGDQFQHPNTFKSPESAFAMAAKYYSSFAGEVAFANLRGWSRLATRSSNRPLRSKH